MASTYESILAKLQGGTPTLTDNEKLVYFRGLAKNALTSSWNGWWKGQTGMNPPGLDQAFEPYKNDPLAKTIWYKAKTGSEGLPVSMHVPSYTWFSGGGMGVKGDAGGNSGTAFDLRPDSVVSHSGKNVYVDGVWIGEMNQTVDATNYVDGVQKQIDVLRSNRTNNTNLTIAESSYNLTDAPGVSAPTPDRVPGTGAPSGGPADDATDAAAISKQKFDLRKTEFSRDIVPQIQQKLNAAGTLESGAMPEALARALRGAGSATTVDELNTLEKSTLAGFDPLLTAAHQSQLGQANRTLGGASYNIDQLLSRLRMGAGQSEQPDILAQLLGVGSGIGGNLLAGSLRRRRPAATPDYTNASSLDLYAPGSYRSSGVPY